MTGTVRGDSQESSPLEQGVWRQLDTRNQRAWREGSLLNIPVIVLRVSVELEYTDLLHWELGPRPDLGSVEWIEADLGSFFGCHNLDLHGPFDVSALVDGFVELSLGVVGVETLGSKGLVKVKLLGRE